MSEKRSAVHPSPRQDTPASAPRYRLVPCRPLPAFDPTPTLKTLLLPVAARNVYTDAVRKTHRLLLPAFWLSIAVRFAAFFVPGDIGEALAVASAVLQLPAAVNLFLGVRSEFLKVLCRTYDFWLHEVTMTVCVVTLGAVLHTHPVRLAMLLGLWLEFTNALIVEATQVKDVRAVLTSAVATVAFMSALIGGVAFDALAGAEHYELLSMPNHLLSTQDVLMNTMATLMMLYVRLVHNSAQNLRRKSGQLRRTAVRSQLYRCALRWQKADRSGTTETPVAIQSLGTQASSLTDVQRKQSLVWSSLVGQTGVQLQLTLVDNPVVLDAQATVSSRLMAAITKPSCPPFVVRLVTLTLHASGIAGVTCTAVTLLAVEPVEHADRISATGFGCSLVFTSVMFACCQRRVLRQLATSFNFVFLSLQISIAHLCLCDAFYWQTHKTLGVFASWLWLHLVLAVDTLTPVVKARLGFKVWFLVPVVLLAIIGQVLLGVELAWRNDSSLQHRVVWEIKLLHGQPLVVYSSSILLGRLATLVAGLLRWLCVAVRRQSDDELVLLQGAVEYDYAAWRKRAATRPGS